jgi:hypothetical protein
VSLCLRNIWCAGRVFALVFVIATGFAGNMASADEPGRTWIYTAADLVQALKGDLAPEASDSELRRMLSAARGEAYIAGVADQAGSTGWCGAGKILPHELASHVFTHLEALPPQRLEENAAKLTGEALASIFPCGAQKN